MSTAHSITQNKKIVPQKQSLFVPVLKHLKKDRQLLLMFLPCVIFYIVFRYGPIYGVSIAFFKYDVYSGILKSPFVGLKYFMDFFQSYDIWTLLRNTFLLGFYTLLWTFPFPIIFALLLNEIKSGKFRKAVQTASYLPSFVSIVVISSLIIDFLSPNQGIINNIISVLGFDKHYFIADPEWFRTIYIASEIWSGLGIASIYYFAAISGVDPELYEAGIIDGCDRFQAIRHITLPGILPTIVTLFIINSGNMFRIGYEKVLLLYNPSTYETADVISTFVYRKGLVELNLSYGAAVGLFESLITLVLLLLANYASRKINETSLW